jgi:hypothetical protein
MVTNVMAGVDQGDGTYLWKYEVFGGQRPALSHWTLGICLDVFNSIVDNSVVGGPFEFSPASDPDPTTGAIGLKFDSGTSDGQTKIYSFLVNQDWASTGVTATFKAGGNVTTQLNVLAPDCEMVTPVVPEPATLALLGIGGAPLLAATRRRVKR